MVNLKNIVFKSAHEKSPLKGFQEPDGMIDIELREVLSIAQADKGDLKKTSKSKNSASKALFSFGIGCLIITCTLITFALNFDSLIKWSSPSGINIAQTDRSTTNSASSTKTPFIHKAQTLMDLTINKYTKFQQKIKREALKDATMTRHENNEKDNHLNLQLTTHKLFVDGTQNTKVTYITNKKYPFLVPTTSNGGLSETETSGEIAFGQTSMDYAPDFGSRPLEQDDSKHNEATSSTTTTQIYYVDKNHNSPGSFAKLNMNSLDEQQGFVAPTEIDLGITDQLMSLVTPSSLAENSLNTNKPSKTTLVMDNSTKFEDEEMPEILRSHKKALDNDHAKFHQSPMEDETPKIGTTTLSGETEKIPFKNRWSSQDSSKTNAKDFLSEQLQTSQHTSVNHNFPQSTLCPTFVSPVNLPMLQQASAFPYFYNGNQGTQYTNVFPLARAQTNPYLPQQYPYSGTNSLMPVQQGGYLLYNGQNVMNPSGPSGSGGQYYICNPMLGNIKTGDVAEVEIRASSDSVDAQQSFISDILENKARAAENCPFGERSCADDSKCIKVEHFCDGNTHCKDASDEAFCPCKFRIDKLRMCDGFLDCPSGEDELKCFGCDIDMFSCDDWSPKTRLGTCVPIEQRCDGILQCPSGKDEEDCSVLTETLSDKQDFMVSATTGFLFRNFKGRWYPACRNPEMWANEVCLADAGPSTIAPLTHLIPIEVAYNGPYVSVSSKQHIKIVHSCEANAAIFVECPPLVCGMRRKIRNHYRTEEVDTSAELILSQLHITDGSGENATADDVLGNVRVVGGRPSQPESWPWVVSIYRNGVFHCGGVVINEHWIVTAAHCVDKYWHYYYEIQVGVLRRYSYSPMVQNRMVSNVISHQLYDRSKLKNDIAMMRMSKPIRFNRYIRPICLPSEITAGKGFLWGPEAGTICTAVGWGATMEHGSDPDHLREVEVPVLKHCKHREDEQGREICAGLMEGGKDACQGDSGGPFMCRNPNLPNQWYLAGIVSHGEGCARPNEPGVYTRVSLFLEWIFENIRAEVLPQSKPLHHCPGYLCRKTNKCITNKRRCDKIVDCLLADDEFECDKNGFNDIFKHAMRHMFFRAHEDPSGNNETVGLALTGEIRLSEGFNSTTEKLETDMNSSSSGSLNISKFVCQRMLQTIDAKKKCDKVADCEDATDEEGCLCVDYLKNTHLDAVCDGVVDCVDMSDEENCVLCHEDEYHCHQSNTCISSKNKCNGIPECPMAEDERDCFALTNGKTLMLDGEMRPYLKSSGIVSFNHNGTWRVLCGNWTDTEASLASKLCFYLGFGDYQSFSKVSAYNNSLQVTETHNISSTMEIDRNNKCMSLFVKCSNAIDSRHFMEFRYIDKTIDVVPWNAEVYVNGMYKCMGTILNTQWVITSSGCFQNNLTASSEYVTVLVGGRKSYLNVVGLHEQTLRVINITQQTKNDIILLKLAHKIKFTRYVRPISFAVKEFTVRQKETCIAIGRNFNNSTSSIQLQSTFDCSAVGFRCFKRITPIPASCRSQDDLHYKAWSGCIVCLSKAGWYPAAVFHEPRGFCGFTSAEQYTSVQYWKGNVIKSIKKNTIDVEPPPCEGFRCDSGECIDKNDVCDGIPDCRHSNDEDLSYCNQTKTDCQNSSSCVCLKSELKCKNGKCVPKASFCNTINECGDWSDEPDVCTCGSYLALTKPEKVCDGIRNCQDRTDENPNRCKCTEHNFPCEKSRYCISKDMVCDGIPDCPNGEDENHCSAMVSTSKSLFGEVQLRTAGVWHSGCFPKYLTTLQLENICEKLGFVGGSAARINPRNESLGTWRIRKDPFQGVWIHENNDNKLILLMRSGNEPFVHFVPDSACHKLFLQCL